VKVTVRRLYTLLEWNDIRVQKLIYILFKLIWLTDKIYYIEVGTRYISLLMI
jgi:hypothetical protein